MNILWSPEAIKDLNSLRAYIAQDNPSAARAVALHMTHSIEQLLPDNPQMGRPGRVPQAHVSSSSPRRPSLSPIDCSEMSFKFCASITGRAAGLKAFSALRTNTFTCCGPALASVGSYFERSRRRDIEWGGSSHL